MKTTRHPGRQTGFRSRHPSNGGFTLIELIVVMTLMGVLLYLAIPRFQNAATQDPGRNALIGIANTIRDLKRAAVQEHRDCTMHLLIDRNAVWISDETMGEEALMAAQEKAYRLPEDLRLLDVEYPLGKFTENDAVIRFYKKGYSDPAIIHLEGSDFRRFSLRVEPFLPQVDIHDTYIGFTN